ncbi:MAG TPA: PAS domain-containing protein, partial [Legionellaceae bacterium]|nr:PAS domain-containing protein [Legionellaceae bacterium]
MNIHYQEIFLALANNTDHLFLIISNDFHILDINPMAEQILGWQKSAVINQKITSLFNENIQPFINLKTPLKTISYNTSFITQQYQNFKILWKIIPCNEVILIVGQKSYSQNEPIKNLQFENILRHAPGLFYWKDCNSVYQGCNDEFSKLAGLKSRYEVIGKTDHELNWKERAHLYINIDQAVIKSGQPILNHEEQITISKNKTITAITNKVPLRNSQGQVIGVLGITTDITHQKEVEKELNLAKEAAEMANRTKTAFIANMSHDIRTPVTGIVGVSSIMEELTTNIELKQYARDVHESGEQLLNMLN